MTDRFMICFPVTDREEGGYSDHPADPGGRTMRGVTQARYNQYRREKRLPTRNVRSITEAEIRDLYRRGYWDAAGCGALPPGVDLAIYDPAVNSGPGRAIRWRDATARLPAAERVKAICRRRLTFLQALSTFRTFGRGWTARVGRIEAKAVRMALEADGASPAVISAHATNEIQKAEADEKRLKLRAGQAASASGGSAAASSLPADLDWSTLGVLAGIILLFAFLGFIAFRAAHQARIRQLAYKEEFK